jgi:type I restriction enzyme S subunit
MFVRFDKEVDYSFMLLMFSSKMCKDYLEKHATGATMLNINSVIVSNMPLMIPPLPTQHSIVAHLDSLSSNVRALEEKLRKMKDECDALKQAMLREVFE